MEIPPSNTSVIVRSESDKAIPFLKEGFILTSLKMPIMTNSKRLFQSIQWFCILIFAVILNACSAQKNKPAGESPIKIGISAPMTGEVASWGESFPGGALLAIKKINNAGGIHGRTLEAVIEDDQCSAEGISAITKLVDMDRVTAIIGPACSAAGGPGLPVAQKAGVPAIVTASAPNLTKIGDYIFRNYPSDAFQGRFAADYIFNHLKKRKVAIIFVKNDWGQGINDVFVKRFKELGADVVYDEGITQDTTDMRTQIAKAKAANPDIIYFPVYPQNGVAGIKQMREAAVGIPIIGGDAFASAEVWRVREAEGVIYTEAKTNNPPDFQNQVKAETGKTANVLTPYSYDAAMILAEAIKKVGTDRKAIRDELSRIVYKNAMATPVVEFDANRELKSPEFEAMIIRNGKPELYHL